MYVVSNTDKLIYLGQDYTSNYVEIKALNSGLYYVMNPTDDTVVRTALTTTETTDLDGDIFTVADSSIFRVGEVLGWLSTADARKGSVRVESIESETELKVRIDINNATNVLESGDKLVFLPDNFIPEDDCIYVKSNKSMKLLVKADIANSELNMIVTKLTSTLQKKN